MELDHLVTTRKPRIVIGLDAVDVDEPVPERLAEIERLLGEDL